MIQIKYLIEKIFTTHKNDNKKPNTYIKQLKVITEPVCFQTELQLDKKSPICFIHIKHYCHLQTNGLNTPAVCIQ